MISQEERIPIVEEQAVVGKRLVETGRVEVRTTVETTEQLVREQLAYEEVEVERISRGTIVQAVPQVRQEGDLTIIPVVREELIVTKRLTLLEEIYVRRQRRTEEVVQPVTLLRQRAEVLRHEGTGQAVDPHPVGEKE